MSVLAQSGLQVAKTHPIKGYAKSAGYVIASDNWFYDKAVRGSDAVAERFPTGAFRMPLAGSRQHPINLRCRPNRISSSRWNAALVQAVSDGP
jgi:hypothetical protein